ncbi:hypothetical protein [Nocardioides panzhihuensis]|uniref:Uncharacterized protein n=1 Tax=Nocardioides panzhihuensis TaxID=860243 RepID=A0A7Z0DL20_9ACTN|nr:hypothetical protein [Nocardioides panzhihuensis]NYI77591.1 hypothetical protein [Nocardioides panzhihuensis]
MSASRLDPRKIALATAVLATLPYLTLKLLWLGGSTAGITSSDGLDEMHGTRHVIGNVVTIAMMALAAGFAFALTRPWADRVPAKLVLVLGAGATGLLAPILLGLPIGLAVQTAFGSDTAPREDGLAPWVFGLVYGGFGLLAIALAVLVVAHVLHRWGHLISEPPERPSLPITLAATAGLLPFTAAMAFWGIAGPGDSGPQGLEGPAQRTVLLVTAVLTVGALLVPMARGWAARRSRFAWLVTWTGCCVAALQGPTQLLLAQGGEPQPAVAVVAALATPAACLYGLAILRRGLAQVTEVNGPRGVRPLGSQPRSAHPSSRGSRPR